ncbi:galactocerebrosidase-like isoform X2 [Mercenaria mercenaria]|uniref:galactocerebrosidase-like isoform X2 n=1 Tax=Mercenaria mercenaria TaxID=6596 RepID=UPI00234F0D8F|nr:galactocerebrosidase-like isoform X2 [Mercenaria mercenaria]
MSDQKKNGLKIYEENMKLLLLCGCLVTCTVSQYTFDDSNGLGRRFDGIGGLSGGGATSKLLPGYPEHLRDQILDYLFKPNFGASLHILKVEIGGGSMSGVGSEASHIYHDGDENYQRGYEWWMMKEAKKRNPKIKLYGLPWVFSGWVGNGTNSPYTYPERTVEYIVKWIKGAKEYHGLDIDYIGEWNEQNYNTTYLKMLRQGLDKNNFEHIQIVAADDFQAEFETNLARDMLLDLELSSAVNFFGVHYSSTQSNLGSIMWGKQLWASEDYSSFNDVKGARCWARILNQNYVNGLMTSTISWNLIAAYYEGMPYQRCGLMTANSPWSGHYDVNPTIWMTAHTTQFTEPGWIYLSHHSGVGHLVGGGSYVALTSPDKEHLTIVIETIDYADSKCLHEALPQFTVVNQTITFKLEGSFKSITRLHTWFSMLGNSEQKNFTVTFSYNGVIEPDDNGTFTLEAGINQIYTLSTVDTADKGNYPTPPDPKPFPLPYMDNFNDVVEHQEPYFVAPMSGSFEVITSPGSSNKVLRQMPILKPVDWCETENFTLALIGNISWTDIYVETSFSIDMPNATEGVFLAQRINSGGCYTVGGQGFLFFVFPKNATYEFWGDSRRATLLGFGPAPSLKANGFNKLGLKVKGGFAEGYVNGQLVFGVRMPEKPESGFPAFGTAGFGRADFDYIMITES